jgi:hypothetical protein
MMFRGLLINGDLPHACSALQTESGETLSVSNPTQYAEEETYVKEILMLAVSLKKFLNVLMDRLKLTPT